MRSYPYYYFVPADEPFFRSFTPGINKRFFAYLFLIPTTLLQISFYSMLTEKYIDNHSYWLKFRSKKLEQKAAYDVLIRINADTKPNIIKEFSSF